MLGEAFFKIAFYFLLGSGLVALIYIINWFVAPRTAPTELQNSSYECGDETQGSSWGRFHLGYYPFALLFVVFDVEALFLFAWVAIFKQLGMFGFVEVMLFICILVIGLIYAWRKGALRWA